MDLVVSRGKLLRISSEDKKEGQNNANYSVSLGNTSYVQNVRGIILKNLSFKQVFPNVFTVNDIAGSGNSSFTFNYNGVYETVIFDEGWYTAADYRAQLELLINALPAILNPITVTLPSVPTGSSLSRKFTITPSGGDLIGWVNKTSGNNAADLVGIQNDTGLLAVLVADYLPDFGGLSTIYLCSGTLAGYNAAASSNGGEQVPIIAAIPINTEYGKEVYYESKDPLLDIIFFNNDRNLDAIDLSLCTRDGTKLSLQQNNMTALFRLIHASRLPSD